MSSTGTYEKITRRHQIAVAGLLHACSFCPLLALQGKGTDFLFIEGSGIQREGGLYNDNDGREYPASLLKHFCRMTTVVIFPAKDNLHRFTLLCLAAMEASEEVKAAAVCAGRDQAPLILDINRQGKYGDKARC